MASPVLVGPVTDTAVDEFLSTFKPSANNDNLGPWIWVRTQSGTTASKAAEELDSGDSLYTAFEKDGLPLRGRLEERCTWIKENAPVRGKKKEGIQSQKELREAEHEIFNKAVAEIAKKHGVVTGKWLFFSTPEFVDATWSKIVKAIALSDGALAKTGAVHTAKVSSTSEDSKNYVICVYCDNSWDKVAVAEVFKVLVRDLALVSSAYKCDANTLLGIDSKHMSGIRSSLYGKTTFMTQDEITELLETKSKAKEVKKKNLEQELAGGAGDGFDSASESEEEERPRKKTK